MSKGIIFAKKILIFCKKDAEISKINRAFVLKLHMCVNVHTKFQFSTIILTSSRQGVILPPSPTSKQSRKRSTQIRVKNMNKIYIQNIDQSYVNWIIVRNGFNSIRYLLLRTFKLTSQPNISTKHAEVRFFTSKWKYNFQTPFQFYPNYILAMQCLHMNKILKVVIRIII